MHRYLLFILLSLGFISTGHAAKITYTRFHDSTNKLTIEIPSDWRLTKLPKNLYKRSKKIIEKQLNHKVEDKLPITILNAEKNKLNKVTISCNKDVYPNRESYEKQMKSDNKFLFNFLKSRNIKFTYSYGSKIIDNKHADTLFIHALVGNSRIKFEQRYYNLFINGYGFEINAGFTSEDNLNEITRILDSLKLRASKCS